MEPMHIFYKELPVDENNTFTADITKKKKKKKKKKKMRLKMSKMKCLRNQWNMQ